MPRKPRGYLDTRRLKNGELRYRSWYVGPTKRKRNTPWVKTPGEALKARERALALAGKHTTVPTLGQALDAVRLELATHTKEGNVAWFDSTARALRLHLGEDLLLTALTPLRLQEFQVAQLGRVSASSVLHYRRALSVMFSWAIRRDLLPANPLDKVRAPRAPKKPGHWFRIDEGWRVIDTVAKHGDRQAELIFQLLFQTGLRRSEAARLRVEHVDAAHSQLWVIGKNREEWLPVVADVFPVIEELAAGRRGVVVEDGVTTIDSVHRLWKRKLPEPRLHPHTWRHSFTQALVDAGWPIQTVMHYSRHATLTSLQCYLHHNAQHEAVLGAVARTPGGGFPRSAPRPPGSPPASEPGTTGRTDPRRPRAL